MHRGCRPKSVPLSSSAAEASCRKSQPAPAHDAVLVQWWPFGVYPAQPSPAQLSLLCNHPACAGNPPACSSSCEPVPLRAVCYQLSLGSLTQCRFLRTLGPADLPLLWLCCLSPSLQPTALLSLCRCFCSSSQPLWQSPSHVPPLPAHMAAYCFT